MKKYYIYKIENIVNHKLYIGETDNIKRRFDQHMKNPFAKRGRDDCPKLYNSIRKYGLSNFSFSVLEEIYSTEQEALDIEAMYIEKYNTVKMGLNIVHKSKCISGIFNPMYGKGYLISGNKNGMYGKVGNLNPFYGKTHSKEVLNNNSKLFSKFSEEIIAEIKMMMYNKMPSKQIKEKYPGLTDKMLSLMRSGKRWAYILPDIKLNPKFKQLSKKIVIEILNIWNDSKYNSIKLFHDFIKNKYDISYYKIRHIVNGDAWKNLAPQIIRAKKQKRLTKIEKNEIIALWKSGKYNTVMDLYRECNDRFSLHYTTFYNLIERNI